MEKLGYFAIEKKEKNRYRVTKNNDVTTVNVEEIKKLFESWLDEVKE